MKIAISAEKDDIEGKVCDISGRAPYYLIFEDKTLVKTLKNPFAFGGGGAGFGVAKMLEKEQVKKVVSGKIGENMKRALEKAGIECKEKKQKKVKEALEE